MSYEDDEGFYEPEDECDENCTCNKCLSMRINELQKALLEKEKFGQLRPNTIETLKRC